MLSSGNSGGWSRPWWKPFSVELLLLVSQPGQRERKYRDTRDRVGRVRKTVSESERGEQREEWMRERKRRKEREYESSPHWLADVRPRERESCGLCTQSVLCVEHLCGCERGSGLSLAVLTDPGLMEVLKVVFLCGFGLPLLDPARLHRARRNSSAQAAKTWGRSTVITHSLSLSLHTSEYSHELSCSLYKPSPVQTSFSL